MSDLSTERVPEPSAVRRSRTLARVLDTYQLDPILGLIAPGLGDIVTAMVGLQIVHAAMRARAPKILIARMILHLAFDILLGAVPLLGDAADFVYRANRQNLDLLEAHLAAPTARRSAGDWFIVGGAALLLILAMVAPLIVVVWFVQRAWPWFRSF